MTGLASLPLLLRLLRELRTAHTSHGRADDALARATAQLRSDEDYRRRLRGEVRSMLADRTATHLLTEGGILSDEPLVVGFLARIGRRLAPAPLRTAGLEGLLTEVVRPGDCDVLAALRPVTVEAWLQVLVEEDEDWGDPTQLASALVILGTRVAGAGLDPRLCERMPRLEVWTSPFLELSRLVDRYAEAYVEGRHLQHVAAARAIVARCEARVLQFRAEKEVLGTTLHLSSSSLRMLQQLRRMDVLIGLTLRPSRAHALLDLVTLLGAELSRGDPARTFVRQKVDLLAWLVVGHAAQKGDAYAAHSRSEYLGFAYKSLLGGVLVAVFALLKVHLSHQALAPVPQGLVYGLNYAICFALIYACGATLATKQPAYTASRIADALGGPVETVTELARAIFRSQFISFVGNVVGAAGFAIGLTVAFTSVTGQPFIEPDKASKLMAEVHPLTSGTVFFAAIAGVLLSAAGFVAALVDNAVVFHRLGDRVAGGGGVFSLLGERSRKFLAERIEKGAGGITGNVALGFMLGSAGTVGEVLGLPLDIRHIAFSSSHGALALWSGPELRTPSGFGVIASAVVMIGVVNFAVSFSLTLAVAINARRLDGADWQGSLRAVWAQLRADPTSFVVPAPSRS